MRFLTRITLIALVLPAAAAAAVLAQPRTGIVHIDGGDSLPLTEHGSQLYAANCASCHGIDGRGVAQPRSGAGDVTGQGPSLRGVGARAADFYLRTGYMPLETPGAQPHRQRVLFSQRELSALIAYVASLEDGPPVPQPRPDRGNLADGFELFTERCAGCHQVVAQGGVATGARVPPLENATATQIAEAVRIGPYLMPSFSERDISDRELDSIIAYVQLAQHPVDRGGWGIGNLGPFPEGMVTWLLAALALVAVCMVIGRRLRE